MMKRYGKMMNKSIKIIIIPFLTPRLSSYWIDLVTPLRASLARPLIDSLKHEAVTKDDSIKGIIPLQLKNFEEAIRAAKEEQLRKSNITKKERTSHSLNTKILLISLFVMAVIGSTYYVDPKRDVIHATWFVLSGLWYFGIAFSMYFVLKSTRLGSITAGIIGWVTLGFWLIGNTNSILGHTLIVSSSDLVMAIRDFISVVTAALVVVTSHNIFHKIRVHEF
jgi:hypothetical protein